MEDNYMIKSPIYENYIKVQFSGYPYLSLCLKEVYKNEMTFNLNMSEDDVMEPVESILDMIKRNISIEVVYNFYDMTSKLLSKITLTGFKFITFLDLLDISFDYTEKTQKTIRVSFCYEQMF